MNRRFALILLAVVAATLAPLVYVPYRVLVQLPTGEVRPWVTGDVFWKWSWRLEVSDGPALTTVRREGVPRTRTEVIAGVPTRVANTERIEWGGDVVYWPYVWPQQLAILLLGGGLLTFVVRRERWRRATL